MSSKIIIGIDLGGTKIMTGAITKQGEVIGTPVKVLTGGNDEAGIILKRIIGSIEKTLIELDLNIQDIEGIGIGTTGPVDHEKGMILECPQLPNMHFFNLREAINRHFNIHVCINNDANCMTLGECLFGAAEGKRNVVGFTLGTGLGCAIILNRKIFNGSTSTAAEIWPSPYGSGTIEDFISGTGVTMIYKSISGKEKSSLDIYNLACEGDKEAIQTWNEFGAHLAVPIAWAVNLIDPEIVVIGGSIAAAYPFFIGSVEAKLRKWICPVPSEKTKVVLSKLGDYAGIVGAACLLMDYV